MWKPALIPDQLYPYVQKQAMPLNFNSYGTQSRPFMSPMQQSYVFAIPTKVNYASYQPIKEIEEKRKPGNLHHVTIINAMMPKPYLPTAPTYSHQINSFKNYRTNNKQLYHQYLNYFGRQNMENFNNINAQQPQLQKHQHQPQQTVYSSSSLALQMDKPTIEYMTVKNQNSKINDIENNGYAINTPVSQCGRQNSDDAKNSGSDVFYYYCNNRITNYKNPTQQHLTLTQPTKISTSTSTTTTSKAPATKLSHFDLNIFTTESPIFLPTPNAPLKNSFIPITIATIVKNSIADSASGDSFRLQKKYNFGNHQEIMSRHEDIKQRQQYTTAAAHNNMKLHSFFTIEDAVTRAPEMQVFNDSYQAYKHAVRQQSNHQRQTTSTTKIPSNQKSTKKSKFQSFFDYLLDDDYITPKAYTHLNKNQANYRQHTSATTQYAIPETTSITTKAKFKSFFDDLDDEDYQIPDAHQNDYALFNIPQKSAFYKPELKSKQRKDHTEKNELINDGEIFEDTPKIKETHFELFKSISPTTYALTDVTTYKPKGIFKKLFLTTHKTPFLTSYSSKTRTFAPTFETELDQKAITEIESSFFNPVSTTTTLPITTTTERKFSKITLKPPLNFRSSTAFKYPKQKVHKSYKNLTSTTTKATTALKKVPKYQRQYKTKKLKQFKHLYTTTSTTSTSTTTSTAIPTTIESHTKSVSSTSEESTTKKSVFSRVYPTTDVPKDKNLKQQSSLTTEVTKRKVRVRTTTPSTIKNNDSSIRLRSVRRGSKRANISQIEKETSQVSKSQLSNRNMRRLTSSSSTTARPLITRTTPGLTSTSTISPNSTHVSLRTLSTTTTIKSIMKIPNSKSRRRHYSDIKSTIKTSNEVSDDRQALNGRVSLKSTTSTMADIPPLPIEIYFQKSHNSKI